MWLRAAVACNWPKVVVFMYLKTGKRPSTATCCHQSFISQCGHWNTSAYKWFMGTYCLPWTFFFPLILDIISRTLYIMSYREANTSLAASLNTTKHFYNPGFRASASWRTDGRTNGQTESGRQTHRHVRGGTLPAGEAGEREHLPAGLRSSHGFCESGSPLTPVAGQEGPRWCQRVRGITNGSKYHHLKGSERSGTNLLTCVTPAFQITFLRKQNTMRCWLFREDIVLLYRTNSF